METHKGQLEITNIKTILSALLVEDYVPCQKIMTHYLRALGYEVDLADDSLTALQKIRENNVNVGTPIIVWSAYINKNNEEKYLLWGADAALIKVCDINGLKNVIWKCLLTPRYEREFHYKLKILQKKMARKWSE